MKAALLALLALLALPVQADVIGDVQSSAGRIELHAERGPACMEPARHAVFVGRHGAQVPGCWTLRDGSVLVVFFDGDVAQIPVQAIRKPTRL